MRPSLKSALFSAAAGDKQLQCCVTQIINVVEKYAVEQQQTTIYSWAASRCTFLECLQSLFKKIRLSDKRCEFLLYLKQNQFAHKLEFYTICLELGVYDWNQCYRDTQLDLLRVLLIALANRTKEDVDLTAMQAYVRNSERRRESKVERRAISKIEDSDLDGIIELKTLEMHVRKLELDVCKECQSYFVDGFNVDAHQKRGERVKAEITLLERYIHEQECDSRSSKIRRLG
ncbi:hypothetical protein SARC_00096 [Sphaeroforma arctica JP610]|uniref:Uncharacterized protein n=1 Tax=Sphaeroforma arctica JP610 TaxID=667725 RepID=A0A0L0GG46_9EUKA|nr:hypothetical protein SARC_00096 [Sphaeroforma arctica JP610]KNC87839.1 hypothetical protein SARC_00096 [Sphaeroforma arctica JP610]|eukprot:XP_014161741.1 hypothetical protein SARC_00096 [Sphaeroforma arctica JP610]